MRGTTGDVSPGERWAKGCPFECKSGRHISALDIGDVSMNFAISPPRYCLLFNQTFVRYAMQRVWIHVDEENLKN